MIEGVGHIAAVLEYIILLCLIGRSYRKERKRIELASHYRRLRYILHACLPLPLVFVAAYFGVFVHWEAAPTYPYLYMWVLGPIVFFVLCLLYLIHAVKMKHNIFLRIAFGVLVGIFGLWTGIYVYLGVGFATGMIAFM